MLSVPSDFTSNVVYNVIETPKTSNKVMYVIKFFYLFCGLKLKPVQKYTRHRGQKKTEKIS